MDGDWRVCSAQQRAAANEVSQVSCGVDLVLLLKRVVHSLLRVRYWTDVKLTGYYTGSSDANSSEYGYMCNLEGAYRIIKPSLNLSTTNHYVIHLCIFRE